VYGSGDVTADIMFVGEAPGKDEDLSAAPFVGRSGKFLLGLVEEILSLTRQQVFIANVVKCRPPENRNPTASEVEACTPWLQEQLQLVRPLVVVPVGNFASRFLLQTKDGITTLRGTVYEIALADGFSAAVVPTFHPAAALQGGGADVIAKIRADLALAATALVERRSLAVGA
jgi:DNA polymerase